MTFTQLRPAPFIPLASNWTEAHWTAVAATANRLPAKGVELALRGLRRAFPDAEALAGARHPVVALQLTVAGRAYLLELGLAIAVLSADDEDIARLRNPEQFQGRATELLVGFMFRRRGVRVARPPHIPGRSHSEFFALFPDGQQISVEAKHLEVSERARNIEPVFCALVVDLPTHFQWLKDVVDRGARATFRFSDAISDLGNRYAVDFQQVRQLAETASAQLQAALRDRDPFGTFELDELGTVTIRPDKTATDVVFDAFAPRSNAGLDDRRVRRIAKRAMQQLRESGLPGIIVLDLKLDGLARNTLPFLRKWAARQHGLIAVLAMERHSFGGGSCSGVDVLPGLAFDSGNDSWLDVLDLCEAGHFHYSPLNDLMSPCPLAAWMS